MELSTKNQNRNMELPLYFEENFSKYHECDMLKTIFIREGSTILNINNQSFVISAPALLCLNNKDSFKIIKSGGLISQILYFSPSIVNVDLTISNIYDNPDYLPGTAKLDHFYLLPFIDKNNSSIGQVDIGLVTAKKLSILFDELKIQISNFEDEFWPCRNRTFLIQILFLIQHFYSKREITSIIPSEAALDINEIILYLHLNYDRKITIDEITGKFHTNRNSLNNRFNKEMGLSVFEYITKLRISVASMLLRDTNLPIIEIAERVGFGDISYWGRTFKKFIGTTPTNYRKSYMNGN